MEMEQLSNQVAYSDPVLDLSGIIDEVDDSEAVFDLSGIIEGDSFDLSIASSIASQTSMDLDDHEDANSSLRNYTINEESYVDLKSWYEAGNITMVFSYYRRDFDIDKKLEFQRAKKSEDTIKKMRDESSIHRGMYKENDKKRIKKSFEYFNLV